MGDMGDMYRGWKEIKKEQNRKREAANMEVINMWLMSGNIKYAQHISDRGGTILFRFPGKPKADFYPTKNKWRKGNAIYRGDAKKFLDWYVKQ